MITLAICQVDDDKNQIKILPMIYCDVVKFITLVSCCAIICTTKVMANDDYKPDNANCLKYAGKICSEIIEPKDCTVDGFFVKDDKGRIISTGSREVSKKKNGVLQQTESLASCYGHNAYTIKYYFNDDVDFASTNCAQVFELWKKAKRKLGHRDQKGYTGFENCFARDPQSLSKICHELSIKARGIQYKPSSCELTSDSFTHRADLTFMKSDIDGYKLSIVEVVETTY